MFEGIEFLFDDLSAGPYIPDVPPSVRQLGWAWLNLLRANPFLAVPITGGVAVTALMAKSLLGGWSKSDASEAHERDNEDKVD